MSTGEDPSALTSSVSTVSNQPSTEVSSMVCSALSSGTFNAADGGNVTINFNFNH